MDRTEQTLVKLTKIEERKDAEVPFNIPVNDYRIGYVDNKILRPTIGKSYIICFITERNGIKAKGMSRMFMTSPVVDVWTENPPNEPVHIVFKTLNSIYKLEAL